MARTPKKLKAKVTVQKDDQNQQEFEQIYDQLNHQNERESNSQHSDSIQATVTSTESTKQKYGSARGVSAMYKVKVKKSQGKKCKVRCNYLGVPIGRNRHTFQSYIGMLARTIIPIHIQNWHSVDDELKKKLWSDIEDTFKVTSESKKIVLKSASTKWRQFKANLTTQYVMPNIENKKKLRKPPKKYAFVGQKSWKKFVKQRTTDEWLSLHQKQSNHVAHRKYHHRTSRKGYIGLLEEEEKAGHLEPGEVPDRAVLWKKARRPKDDCQEIDVGLVEINSKIDDLLEKKDNGEFKPYGSSDVLSNVLETGEHSGYVRGVGSLVTPTLYFNLPKEKRFRITKAELLARDRERDADLEKTKKEIAADLEKTKKEMAELRALLNSNNPTPIISEKASCEPRDFHETWAPKPTDAKDLISIMVDDTDCVAIGPTPTEKQGGKKCELAVNNIQNIVAFGTVINEDDMDGNIHEVQPGCVLVSVDSPIQGDALVPIPVLEKIETVNQAIGFHISWPQNLIIFPNARKHKKDKQPTNELLKVQAEFAKMEVNKNVPLRYRLMYKHATTYMKATGNSIQLPCDIEVFGLDKTIYILHENLISLLEFKMIGQAIISAYMAYLHTVVRANDTLDMFGFVDPGATFNINSEFQAYIVKRLYEGCPDRIFFLPHNENVHWILVLIEIDEICFLNPLPHTTGYPELEKTLSRAVQVFNIETGRGNKTPKIKYISGCPKQPGGTECGYVIMRYMKEIIEDSELSFQKKWSGRTRRTYGYKELDEVRSDALDYIQGLM